VAARFVFEVLQLLAAFIIAGAVMAFVMFRFGRLFF
jgi:hypothetical protein